MKTITSLLTLLFVLAVPSWAVPNLQVYSPDGVYDAATDTWVIGGGEFELWLVAANLDKRDYYDITLGMALGSEDMSAPPSGSVTLVQTKGGSINQTFNSSDFTWGTPPSADPLPPHGIYPTWYAELLVDNELLTGNETVYDYIPGGNGSNNYGFIYKFNVTTTFDYIHFDAYAWAQDLQGGQRYFAPFSHDAEVVPEPTTMALFGFGLLGAGVVRRIRRRP